MRYAWFPVVVGAWAVGCAAAGPASPEPPEPAPSATTAPSSVPARADASPISPAAARIYRLGEERFAEGRFSEAVALWGHALLQLSPDAAADTVRHKLFARMGHGLLQAYGASDDPAYLEDGRAMCELYLTRHEGRFGEADQARAERGEVYELLYQFESRLESHAGVATDGAADEASAPESTAAPRDEVEVEVEVDDEADDDVDGDRFYRFIRVRKVQWARFEDPRVMAFLRDPRDLGPSLLDAGGDPLNPPRVLVRAGGLAQALDEHADAPTRRAARRVGQAVLDAARPALRRCYEQAMARDPVLASRVEVHLTIEPDGHVRQPRLRAGVVIDAEGDVCTAEALRTVVLAEPELRQALGLTLPIQFFHQDAHYDRELFWRERKSGMAYTSTAGAETMPPIDEFSR